MPQKPKLPMPSHNHQEQQPKLPIPLTHTTIRNNNMRKIQVKEFIVDLPNVNLPNFSFSWLELFCLDWKTTEKQDWGKNWGNWRILERVKVTFDGDYFCHFFISLNILGIFKHILIHIYKANIRLVLVHIAYMGKIQFQTQFKGKKP